MEKNRCVSCNGIFPPQSLFHPAFQDQYMHAEYMMSYKEHKWKREIRVQAESLFSYNNHREIASIISKYLDETKGSMFEPVSHCW